MSTDAGKYRGSKDYYLVYAELISAARHRGIVTYQELAKLLGLPLSGNHMGNVLGHILGEICREEVSRGRPMLSVIAVATTGRPGDRFYTWAQELGRFDGRDRNAFWETEKKAVYETWKTVLSPST